MRASRALAAGAHRGNADAPTGRSAGSLIWAGLANPYYWVDPKRGIGRVYLTQVLPFADKRSLPLYFEFEGTVYRHPA